MDFKQYRELLKAYSNVYEQNIGIPLNGRSAEKVLQKMIPKGEKVYTPEKSKKKLQNSHYEMDGDIIDEGKDETEIGGHTGKLVPKKKRSAANQYEYEKMRRKNLAKKPGDPAGDSNLIQALRNKAKKEGNYG